MTRRKRRAGTIVLVSVVLVLILAACGGGGTSEPTGDVQPTATSETEPETEEEPTEEPTLAPSPTPVPTETTPEPATEEPVEVSGIEAQSVLDAPSIDSFRLRLDFTMEGEAYAENTTSGTIEGTFTSDPRAHHLIIQTEGEPSGSLEIIQIADQIYMQAAGQWIQAPVESTPQLEDYYLFGDELEAGETLAGLERVGEESVNGRQTIHYRGDRAFLTANEVGGGEFNLEAAETAEYDVWIDQAENFPVKQTVLFEGPGVNPANPEASGRIDYVLEYHDFNAEISIEPPL